MTEAEERAELTRLLDKYGLTLAVAVDFDGPDVQEVIVFRDAAMRRAYFHMMATTPDMGTPERAQPSAIVWDAAGYRSALLAVDIVPEETP